MLFTEKMAKASLILSDSDVEQGGKEASLEDDFAYNNNVHSASMQIRLGIILYQRFYK